MSGHEGCHLRHHKATYGDIEGPLARHGLVAMHVTAFDHKLGFLSCATITGRTFGHQTRAGHAIHSSREIIALVCAQRYEISDRNVKGEARMVMLTRICSSQSATSACAPDCANRPRKHVDLKRRAVDLKVVKQHTHLCRGRAVCACMCECVRQCESLGEWRDEL